MIGVKTIRSNKHFFFFPYVSTTVVTGDVVRVIIGLGGTSVACSFHPHSNNNNRNRKNSLSYTYFVYLEYIDLTLTLPHTMSAESAIPAAAAVSVAPDHAHEAHHHLKRKCAAITVEGRHCKRVLGDPNHDTLCAQHRKKANHVVHEEEPQKKEEVAVEEHKDEPKEDEVKQMSSVQKK